MAQLSFNKCCVCNKVNGELYCRDCEKFLCQTCKPVHDILLGIKQHTVIDVNKEGRCVFKPKPICKNHKKEYVYYCNQCKRLICSDCTISVHSGHPCCDYMNIVDERRQNVIEIIGTIKAKIQNLDDSLHTITNDALPRIISATNDFDKKVNAVANEVGSVIDSVKNIYKTTASDYQSTETEKMTKVRENLQRVQNEYKNVLLHFENVLLEQHGVTFFFEEKAIQIELENLDEIPDIPTADRIPNFSPDNFRDQIVDELQNKFKISSLIKKTEEIRKLTEKQAEAQHHIQQLERKIAGLAKEKAELSKLNDTLQREKNQFSKIEKNYESLLREKKEEIRKLTEMLKKAGFNMRQKELKTATLISEKTAQFAEIDTVQESDKIEMDAAKLYVAAIYFGTTFSGYAFSTRSDPKHIYTCEWKKNNLLSMKAPTSVLLDSDENFVAFGYEAEFKYMASFADESDDDEDENPSVYYYFPHFTMMLHKEIIDMDSKIKDITGKHTMKAFDIFSMAIEYMKDEAVKKLRRTLLGVDLKDIHFVLTVPAIWHDQSKMLMRKAAEKAGIKGSQLKIAPEPEAAYIYCQELRTEREYTIKEGTKYIVVDLGGETADITAHERTFDCLPKEVVPPSGGYWGGTAVDKEYVKFLKTIFTAKVIEQFEKEELKDYTELIHQFEVKKRSIKSTTREDIVLIMPIGLIGVVKEFFGGVQRVIKQSDLKDYVSFTAPQRVSIKPEAFRNLFKPTIDALITHLVELFKNPNLVDLKHIFMVGGFAECELVQTALRDKFGKTMKIIVPDEAGLAVLKGAVLFGHQPEIVKKRILKKTYGIQSWPAFDPSIHPETKRVTMGGTDRCRDVFFRFATKGEKVETGDEYSQIIQVFVKPDQRTLECGIYVSDDVNPRYITDPSCQRLGILTIPLPQIRYGEQLKIEETIIFGGTELLFRARNLKNDAIYETVFQF